MKNKFNLVFDKWLPVAEEGPLSLADVFSGRNCNNLYGNAAEVISLTKFLLAIVQSAYTPEDDKDWEIFGIEGMKKKAFKYLEDKKDLFWLYGENPFLQFPELQEQKEKLKPGITCGTLTPHVATGNSTVLYDSQRERKFSDADKILLLLTLGFTFGGKTVVDKNSVDKSKGETSTAKSGPFLGLLHSYILGGTLQETIYLNILTKENFKKSIPQDIGIAPWENMPRDNKAESSCQTSYLGRLVPLSRFILFDESSNDVLCREGIKYPGVKDGILDTDMCSRFNKKNEPSAIWIMNNKKPWRELTALLSFVSNSGNQTECKQLKICVGRAKEYKMNFGIMSGGLKVSSNAGEYYASKKDSFTASEVSFNNVILGESWFNRFNTELKAIEYVAGVVYGSVKRFYISQKAEGNDIADTALTMFWQLCDGECQNLINACNCDEAAVVSMRKTYSVFAKNIYDNYCPHDTSRQLETWAECRPNLYKYLTEV